MTRVDSENVVKEHVWAVGRRIHEAKQEGRGIHLHSYEVELLSWYFNMTAKLAQVCRLPRRHR